MQSVRAFSGANDGNEMLKGLRYFERAIQGKPGTDPKSNSSVITEYDVQNYDTSFTNNFHIVIMRQS